MTNSEQTILWNIQEKVNKIPIGNVGMLRFTCSLAVARQLKENNPNCLVDFPEPGCISQYQTEEAVKNTEREFPARKPQVWVKIIKLEKKEKVNL